MAWVNGLNALWRILRRPWLLLAAGVVVGLVLLSAFFLPQMPGQVSSDATAATRWLLGVGAEYGIVGEFLGSLGLFNVLHSVTLQLLLAAITFLLLIAIAESIERFQRYRKLASVLLAPALAAGEPLALTAAQPIYRLRQAVAEAPDALAATLQEQLTQRFDAVTLQGAPLAASAAAVNGAAAPVTTVPGEMRLLAVRNLRWVGLRVIFYSGLLIATLAMWLTVVAGWEVSAVILTPGDAYDASAHQVKLHYVVATEDDASASHLLVNVAGIEAQIPTSAVGQANVDGVTVRVAPAAPGLYVATPDGQARLARAGQTDQVSHLGLAFPSPGSEESLILPSAGIGLRIVRMGEETTNADGTAFMLEVYEGENRQPQRRVAIGSEPTTSIVINDAGLSLYLMLLPSLAVNVRYLPGNWLFWLALLLVVAGGAHFWLRPAFVVAQLNRWPVERSIVILQGDRPADVDALRQMLPAAAEEDAS